MCSKNHQVAIRTRKAPHGRALAELPTLSTTFGVLLSLLLPSAILATEQVWLLAGQSNMIGYGTSTAELPATLQQPQSNVKMFTDPATGWISLAPGSGHDFGPEVTFGRDMAASQPGVDVLLVKAPFGLGNLYDDWRSPNTGRAPAGPHYTNFMALKQAALALKPDAQIAGMIWMQGEGDGYDNLTMATSYADNLRLFIDSVRSDLNLPHLPFVLGQITSSNAWTYGSLVQQAQAEVARTTSNCHMVVTSDLLLGDNMHYTTQSQMTLGSRFSQQALAAIGVPEPDAIILLGSGVLGLLAYAWRRQK